MKVFEHQYNVTFSDINQHFELPINAVLGIFTDAIARQMALIDLGPANLLKMGYLWVIYEFHANLSNIMPLWSNTITVETWVTKISAVRVFVDYRMTSSKKEVFAQGTSTWVVMDGQTRRPVKCSALQPLELLIHDIEETKERNTFHFSHKGIELAKCNHLVTNMDTDFNGHMNNQNYVKLAMSLFPIEYAATRRVNEVHIRFGCESFIGDQLTCSLKKEVPLVLSVLISKGDGGIPTCHMVCSWSEKTHEN